MLHLLANFSDDISTREHSELKSTWAPSSPPKSANKREETREQGVFKPEMTIKGVSAKSEDHLKSAKIVKLVLTLNDFSNNANLCYEFLIEHIFITVQKYTLLA